MTIYQYRDMKGPGNTVECCHGHVGQSEVEQETVGCCPHSLKRSKVLMYSESPNLLKKYPKKKYSKITEKSTQKSSEKRA